MHRNSLKAFQDLPNLPPQRARILKKLLDCGAYGLLGEALTDRQIKGLLGLEDMNEVRPRVNELIKLDLVVEAGDTVCLVTGRRCAH